MSVGYTTQTPQHTAIYDTVTGWAFGPVFDDAGQAHAYVRYCETETGADIRTLPARQLEELHRRWLHREDRP